MFKIIISLIIAEGIINLGKKLFNKYKIKIYTWFLVRFIKIPKEKAKQRIDKYKEQEYVLKDLDKDFWEEII